MCWGSGRVDSSVGEGKQGEGAFPPLPFQIFGILIIIRVEVKHCGEPFLAKRLWKLQVSFELAAFLQQIIKEALYL